MKKILLLLIVTIVLSSCGLFTRVNKEKFKTQTESKEDSSSEQSSLKTDNSITKIVETIDTTVKTKELDKDIISKIDLKDLFKGIVLIDSGLFKISQVYDEQTKTLKTTVKIRPQEVTVVKKKETTIQNNTKTEEKKKEQKNLSNKELVETKTVTKKPVNITIYLLLVLGLIVAGYYGFKFIKKKYPGKIPFL